MKKFLRNKVETCRPDTKIVVLHGIHGQESGLLGNEDNNLDRCFSLAIDQLYEEKSKIIEDKDISIKGVVLEIENEKVKNHNEMVEAIKEADILILAFCYTNINELNTVLRSEGLYAQLILKEEHSSILEEGKLIQLDEEQMKIDSSEAVICMAT